MALSLHDSKAKTLSLCGVRVLVMMHHYHLITTFSFLYHLLYLARVSSSSSFGFLFFLGGGWLLHLLLFLHSLQFWPRT